MTPLCFVVRSNCPAQGPSQTPLQYLPEDTREEKTVHEQISSLTSTERNHAGNKDHI